MTSLRSTLVYGFLLALVACGDDPAPSETTDPSTDEGDGDEDGDGETPSTGKLDAGRPTTAKDAGPVNTSPRDGGGSTTTTPPKDAGPVTGGADAGTKPTADAGKDAGGGFMIPDLFPPASDAGTKPTTPGTGAPGAKDGPCKDLMLFCFDPIDMFLFNPSDCFTCNGGKGCQGCAIPYAF